jgi:hypothetical protein
MKLSFVAGRGAMQEEVFEEFSNRRFVEFWFKHFLGR